ncbi:hypothetical protein S40288_07660 [Stachybotrys chartarum IBT 40288]|nr:hypothetical protein S40288_07660 [Stachybotrys chartarum IBT 40288]
MAGFNIKSSLILALLLAPLVAYLAGRLRVLSLSYYNARGHRIRNCEDVVLLRDRRIALLACDPGRDNWNTVMGDFVHGVEPDANAQLYAYKYDSEDPDALVRIEIVGLNDELRTIGFDFHEPSAMLLLTNHLRQGGPRIEQLRLDLDTFTATHLRSLSHPLISIPNAIAVQSDSQFFVTNQHRFVAARGRLLWFLESYLAPPLANVVHARILASGEVDAHVVARQAYPNGITLLNSTTLAVAATSQRLVHLYTVDKAKPGLSYPTLRPERTIRGLPFLPDNLVTAPDGALLIAGHPHLPSLTAFSHSRRICHRPEILAGAGTDAARKCENTRGASWVGEWTPQVGFRDIYSGWDYPTSATVVRNREHGMGIVAGLYAKGISVWRD